MADALLAKGIHLSTACEPTLSIHSYANALSEVIQQLVTNSIIHAFEHRELADGHQALINIDARINDSELTIQYSDNGAGIDEDLIAKIFEPFYTTKRSTECTGLGMHIVYNLIVHQLAGSITCSSQINEGLKVIITIPSGSY